MAVLVAGCLENRRMTALGDREEVVRLRGRFDGINSHLDVTGRAVFEADRAAQARGELAVCLAFCRPGTDCTPRDQISQVLRADQVEVLGATRYSHFAQVEQQLTCQMQSLVDLEGIVKVGIIDQSLPANGCSRFLEVDPHDDAEVFAQFIGEWLQA